MSLFSDICKSGLIYRGGGRGTPLHKPYRYVLSQRIWFLGLFGLKTGIHFAHFGLKSGMVFEGIAECIFIVSIPNEEERNRNMRIRNAFQNFFCCLRSNLST